MVVVVFMMILKDDYSIENKTVRVWYSPNVAWITLHFTFDLRTCSLSSIITPLWFSWVDDADKSCHWYVQICRDTHSRFWGHPYSQTNMPDTQVNQQSSLLHKIAYHITLPIDSFDDDSTSSSCWWRDSDHDDPANDSRSVNEFEVFSSNMCFLFKKKKKKKKLSSTNLICARMIQNQSEMQKVIQIKMTNILMRTRIAMISNPTSWSSSYDIPSIDLVVCWWDLSKEKCILSCVP